MAIRPPQIVVDKFNESSVSVYRRVEFYEKDGTTPWKPDEVWERLISGNIGVDYARDERRNFECVFDNEDGELDHAVDNLWYDKVLKAFYGIDINQADREARIIIVEEYNLLGEAVRFRNMLVAKGFASVRILTAVATYEEIKDYDIYISLAFDYSRKLTLLNSAYSDGKSIFTLAGQGTSTEYPLHIAVAGAAATQLLSFRPNELNSTSTLNNPVAQGWGAFSSGAKLFKKVSNVASTASYAAVNRDNVGVQVITNNKVIPQGNPRWVHLVSPTLDLLGGTGPILGRNYQLNPSLRNNSTGYTGFAAASQTSARSTLAGDLVDGLPCWKLTHTAAGGVVSVTTGPPPGGLVDDMVFGVRIIATSGMPYVIRINYLDNNGDSAAPSATINRTGTGAVVSESIQFGLISSYTSIQVVVEISAGAVAGTLRATLFSFVSNIDEDAPYCYDGTSAPTSYAYDWVGTPDASQSTVRIASYEGIENLIKSAFTWLFDFTPLEYWECQVGEFVIDNIADSSDNETIQLSCRDYAKRMILSKLTKASTLSGGTVESWVRTVAVNSGITKFRLPGLATLMQKPITYEADTSRWQIAKELASSVGHELFFDSEGFLVMRPFQDPLLTPATLELLTGPKEGNLVKVGRKVGDSRLFNHVVCRGESTDAMTPPVWAEAKNEMEGSPSSIARIGDRVTTFTSPLLTTTAACQTLANSLLKISALEEFEVSFEAVLYPWLEVGEVVEYFYERFTDREVFRYLLSSLSIPFDLSPMSGTSKRVVIVL